jgi:pimeloyl-ACP methyl ester carboxylesterase
MTNPAAASAARRSLLLSLAAAPVGAAWGASKPAASARPAIVEPKVHFRSKTVGDVEVAYREAGADDAPVVLLLHGFPSSGHMFRDLIAKLAGRYRVIAPDLPGFGQTKAPARGQFSYSFDNLAKVIGNFVDALALKRYAIYIFDYGAPTGLRLAMAHPERVTAIVSQNGNAYVEGLSQGWSPIQRYWTDPSSTNRDALREFLKPESIRWQYVFGTPDPTLVSPDGSNLDAFFMSRPGAEDIQLDLFLDYRTNVALYPKFQAYFREHQPPLLAIWGKNDPFFLPAGAEAYRRDLPKAQVQFLDTGHFALETHHDEVATAMHAFLDDVVR